MYLRELNDEIEAYFAAGLTVELRSSPGMGKSQWVRQLRAHLSQKYGFEWGLGIAFLGTYTPIDLMGYMIPAKRMIELPDGSKVETLVSEFTQPLWLFSEDGRPLNSFKKAILFLDEYGQGEPDVKKTAADLRLNGQIGPHKLGKHVHIICASNRSQDRSGVTKSFDFEINRVAYIDLEADFTSWEDWASTNGIPPIFKLFAKKHTEVVFSGSVPKNQGPWCTPRSLVAAIRFLMERDHMLRTSGRTHAGNYGMDDPDEAAKIQHMLTGIIGEEAARTLCGYLRLRHETPDFEQIVADPEGCFVPAKADAKMLTAYECAHFVDKKTMGATCAYMKRFPAEFHITFAKAAIKRNSTFIADDNMVEFVKGNTALMNAIA